MTLLCQANGTNASIPIIDISSPDDDVAANLLEAASTYGVIFIKNTGSEIPQQLVEDMFGMSRQFFHSPEAGKSGYSISSATSGKNTGWLPMRAEVLDPKYKRGDLKELFNFGEFVNDKAQQPLPPLLKSHEAQLSLFMNSCHRLCNKTMEVIARALKIPLEGGGKDWFRSRHDRSRGPSGSILRILYYPALPQTTDYDPEIDIRAGAHSDYGSVTLLFQLPGQPGLEILTAEATWMSVPVNPGNDEVLPILVNIGDLLCYWTNGLLKSTVHRVIFPKAANRGGDDRYSIAYFCHPLDEAKLEPIPSELVQRHSANPDSTSKPITAKEHLESRLAATYKLKSSDSGS